jgi:ankyrin repeat protein
MTMMTVGGLRGAVGLALGIIVDESRLIPREQKGLIMFHMAGIVLLTTLINGTFTSNIYNKLDIYPINPYKQEMFRNTMNKMHREVHEEFSKKLRKDWAHRRAHWPAVFKMMPRFHTATLTEEGHVRVAKPQSLLYAFKGDADDHEHKTPRGSDFEDGKDLCDAAYAGNVEMLKELLESGTNPSSGDYDARTALHKAASQGNITICDLLVQKKAAVNAIDNFGFTPLEDAFANESGVDADLVSLLIAHGAKANLKRFEDGVSMCEAAGGGVAGHGLLQQYVQMGAPVNVEDANKRTPLHEAAADGALESVNFLIEHGAEINAEDRWGKTPTEEALNCSAADGEAVLELLIARGGKVNKFAGGAVLHAAVLENNVPRMSMLVRLGADVCYADSDKRTALHLAASNGAFEAATYLLEHNVNANAKDRWGNTPMRDAMEFRSKAGNLKIAMLLHEHGADAFVSLADGRTMCAAAAHDDVNQLKLCLKLGVKATVTDYDKRSALHLACSEGAFNAAHLLLRHGADVGAVDRFGTCRASFLSSPLLPHCSST